MHEWQNHKPELNTNTASLYQKFDILNKSDILAQNNLSPLQIQNLLKQEIINMQISNISFVPCPYIPHTWSEMNNFFQKYRRNKINFLRFIGYSYHDKCLSIGLDYDDIKKLKNGICPENHTVHIKKPFDFGGTSNFENLSLITTHPQHIQLHSLIEFQIGCGFLQSHKTIYIPHFDGHFIHD